MIDLLSKEAVADIYTAIVHVEALQDDDARLEAGFEVEQLLEQYGGYRHKTSLVLKQFWGNILGRVLGKGF